MKLHTSGKYLHGASEHGCHHWGASDGEDLTNCVGELTRFCKEEDLGIEVPRVQECVLDDC